MRHDYSKYLGKAASGTSIYIFNHNRWSEVVVVCFYEPLLRPAWKDKVETLFWVLLGSEIRHTDSIRHTDCGSGGHRFWCYCLSYSTNPIIILYTTMKRIFVLTYCILGRARLLDRLIIQRERHNARCSGLNDLVTSVMFLAYIDHLQALISLDRRARSTL